DVCSSDLTASEAGTTATITTVGAHGFTTTDFVTITGMTGATCTGYNGNFFKITAVTPPTQFTYTAPGGLGSCTGNPSSFASIGLVVLQPPSITKTFAAKTIQTTGGTGPGPKTSTITFAVTNANVVPIDANFPDTLPSLGGAHPGSLVVAATPGVTNTCGGTVTAAAGSGTISFTNAALGVGPCSITVNVSSTVDNMYS